MNIINDSIFTGIGIAVGFVVFYLVPNVFSRKDGLYISFYWHHIRIELSPDEIADLAISGWDNLSAFFSGIFEKMAKKQAEKDKKKEVK
jgi:hypothetical protein